MAAFRDAEEQTSGPCNSFYCLGHMVHGSQTYRVRMSAIGRGVDAAWVAGVATPQQGRN